MKITFTPIRHDAKIEVVRQGDTLTVNGKELDFSAVSEGSSSESFECDWLIGPVSREAGELVLTLALPHSPDAGEGRFEPHEITLEGDGPVPLPEL